MTDPTIVRSPRRRRRLALAVGVALAAVVVVAYVLASAIVWNRLTRVSGDCPASLADNHPTRFLVPAGARLDPAAYAMPEPRDVVIPSRDPVIEVSGWWLPSAEPDALAALVVHGLGSCKRDHAVLLPASMLHRSGFSVLLIDLRDHGDSTFEDGRYAGGTDEYLDLLGAWDWLVDTQGIPAERVGVLGISMGAATALIAAGEEPRIAAVWEDSSYGDIGVAIRSELERNGYPTILEWGGIVIAWVVSGDELGSRSPLDAVRRLAGRPLFVTHGTADSRLSVDYAADLLGAIRDAGGDAESWIVEGAEHVEAMLLHPEEYESRLVAFFSQALDR